MTPPPLHSWQRIIHELEQAGGYAQQRALLAAAGYGGVAHRGQRQAAVDTAGRHDARLFEESGDESPDGQTWLGLRDLTTEGEVC